MINKIDPVWEVHEMSKNTSASGGLGEKSIVDATFIEIYNRVIVAY